MKLKAALLASALVFTTALGGCATNPTTGVTVVNPNFTAIVAEVQAACTVACSFVPTAATIVSIVTAGNPGVVTGAAIASAICAALQAAPVAARKGASVGGVVIEGWTVSARFRGSKAVPMVNGVPIIGRYVVARQ
jgi:hypothetical protein